MIEGFEAKVWGQRVTACSHRLQRWRSLMAPLNVWFLERLRNTIFLSKFTFYFLGAPGSAGLPLPVSVLSHWRSSKQVDAPFCFGHSSLPSPWDAVPIERYCPRSHISWRCLLRHLCTQEFFQEIPIFLDSFIPPHLVLYPLQAWTWHSWGSPSPSSTLL